MRKFKIGDRARIVFSIWPGLVGRECTVVGVGGFIGAHGKTCPYAIVIDGVAPPAPHGHWLASDNSLEPILKRPDMSTWQAVAKATGWNPTTTEIPA